jgi:hypothetical protein
MHSRVAAVATFSALMVFAATPGVAVEVRQPDTGANYYATLVRAYAPCLTPNTTTTNGLPACSPAVTSTCDFRSASLAINGSPLSGVTGRLNLLFPSSAVPPECAGPYLLRVTVRASGTPALGTACSGGACTFQDLVIAQDVASIEFGRFEIAVPDTELVEPSFEILHAVLIAPDGLPLASSGVGIGVTNESVRGTLTVPYAACTTPDPDGRGDACNLAPWTSSCDFNGGELALTSDWHITGGELRTIMAGLAGSSPLCTNGTYHVETTIRATVDGCGTEEDPERCTVVDQTVLTPVEVDGSEVDTTSSLALGSFHHAAIELRSARLLDPTGEVLGAIGVPAVRMLLKPQVLIAPDQLQLRTTIPFENAFDRLDPTAGDTAITLTDRNGVVFAVTIPPDRWQLQPPVGTRWDYIDKLGMLNGIRKIRIKSVGKPGAITGYRFDLRAKNLDLSAAGFPGVNLSIAVPKPDEELHVAQRNRTCRVNGLKLKCK